MEYPKSMTERRLKIASVSKRMLLDFLNMSQHATDFDTFSCIQLPVTEEIPEGALVVGIESNWGRMSLDLYIWHSSYTPVEEGAEIPRLNGYIRFEVLRRVVLPYNRTGCWMSPGEKEGIKEARDYIESRFAGSQTTFKSVEALLSALDKVIKFNEEH